MTNKLCVLDKILISICGLALIVYASASLYKYYTQDVKENEPITNSIVPADIDHYEDENGETVIITNDTGYTNEELATIAVKVNYRCRDEHGKELTGEAYDKCVDECIKEVLEKTRKN